ncbi:MAG: alpha/beta hydrolase [Mycobacterium sp.]
MSGPRVPPCGFNTIADIQWMSENIAQPSAKVIHRNAVWPLAFSSMSQASIRSRALAVLAYTVVRPLSAVLPANRTSVALIRLGIRILCQAIAPVRGTLIESGPAEMAGEWVRAPGTDDAAGVVLLLHGSGYAFCSPRTHRGFASHISRHSGLPVFVPQYRLAPEHRFPAAQTDVFAAYRWLLRQGYSSTQITIVGDSAGGHLAIAVARLAREEGLPTPAALVLFGPLIDPSFETAMADKRARRSPLSPRAGQRILRLYIGDHDVSDPQLSVLNAPGNHLPPIQLHYGSLEVMRSEAEKFAAHVNRAGGSCTEFVWPALFHGFWMAPALLPEAYESVRTAGQFLRQAVTGHSRGAVSTG